MALIINPNRALEQSYVDITYADNYFEFDLEAELWRNSIEEDKKMALVTATRQIDRLNFQGVKALPEQLLEFPRRTNTRAISDHELMKLSQRLKQEDLVPEDIKMATCEHALFLLATKNADKTFDDLQAKNVSSYTVGDVSVSFKSNSYTPSISQISSKARTYLDKYIKRYTRLI